MCCRPDHTPLPAGVQDSTHRCQSEERGGLRNAHARTGDVPKCFLFEQGEEFGRLVYSTATQIEAGQFLPHSGIRFPMNGCTSCAHLGLCLGMRNAVGFPEPGGPKTARYGANGSFSGN
jgi:hypothetical protein